MAKKKKPIVVKKATTGSEKAEQLKVPMGATIILPVRFQTKAGNLHNFVPSKYDTYTFTVGDYWEQHIEPTNPQVLYIPPYQRQDDAWSRRMQQEFIISCIRGHHTEIHLVKKRKGELWWIMDGVQRTNAIRCFFNNEFYVELYVVPDGTEVSEGKYVKLYWKDIATCRSLKAQRASFLKSPLWLTQWDWMPMTDQKLLFYLINQSSALSNQEKLYCPNFHTRALMRYAFDTIFGKLRQFLPLQVEAGVRFADVRPAHELLVLVYGYEFDSTFEVKPIKSDDMRVSAEWLDNRVIKLIGEEELEDNGLGPDEIGLVMEELGLDQKINRVRCYADGMAKIFENSSEMGAMDTNARNITDWLAFMMVFDQRKDYKPEWIADDEVRIRKAYDTYLAKKRQGDYRMTTTDARTMRKKFKLFSQIFTRIVVKPHKK